MKHQTTLMESNTLKMKIARTKASLRKRQRENQNTWCRLCMGIFSKTKSFKSGLEALAGTDRNQIRGFQTNFQELNPFQLQTRQKLERINKIVFSVIRPFSQYFSSVFSNQNHMFPLSWRDSWRYHSPTIIPGLDIIRGLEHDDRFYCEYMSFFHSVSAFILCVIDIRSLMHLCPYSMTSEKGTDCQTKLLCSWLDSVSDFWIGYTWTTYSNCLIHCKSCDFDKVLNVGMYITDHHHRWVIPVIPVNEACYIDVYCVSRLKGSCVWDSMA